MAFLVANWKNIVLALLAIDAAIIPIFPNAGILKTVSGWLTTASKA